MTPGNACGSSGGFGIDRIGIGELVNLKMPPVVPVGALATVYVNVLLLTTEATLKIPLGAFVDAVVSTILTLHPAPKLWPPDLVTVIVVPLALHEVASKIVLSATPFSIICNITFIFATARATAVALDANNDTSDSFTNSSADNVCVFSEGNVVYLVLI